MQGQRVKSGIADVASSGSADHLRVMTGSRAHVERSRAETVALRQRRKAEAEALGVDAAFIDRLVENFYERIRADGRLGPTFAARIGDWPHHLARMKSFWRSILHQSGEFSGNPMARHLAIPGLGEADFAHWLKLFYATLRDLAEEDGAVPLVAKRARMIADSLLTGIETQRLGLAGARAGENLPHP